MRSLLPSAIVLGNGAAYKGAAGNTEGGSAYEAHTLGGYGGAGYGGDGGGDGGDGAGRSSPVTGGGSKGKGALVFHCEAFGFVEGGNIAVTPSGNVNTHCRG